MRVSLYWRSGLAFLALLLAVLVAGDLYVSRVLRRQAQQAGFAQLDSLARVGLARPPRLDQAGALGGWVAAMAAGGTRVTVIGSDGRVLADSAQAPAATEDASGREEFRQALSTGEGRAVRHSAAGGRDMLYLARRYQPAGAAAPVVLRFALPLAQVDRTAAGVRWWFWGASLLLLVLAGGAFLLVSRETSGRVRRLHAFARRVAAGDFRPLETGPGGDELDDLARALNETARHLQGNIRVLTDERDRWATILRSMAEGVAVISAQQRVLFSNRAFSQILGLDAMAAEGRPVVEAVRQPDLLAIIMRVLAGREQISSEIVVGTVRPRNFAVTAAPVHAEGPAAGAVLVLHEITDLRRLERVRRDFVANVSHEFRTPLTAIQGFAETLLGGAIEDAEHRRRFVEIIRDHAARLARLTEDLLELSRIEAGRLELEYRPLPVHQIVAACLETARLKAERKRLELDVAIPPNLPEVRGDARHLQEVLQNLLDNAVQYTPAGGRIEVSAAAAEGQVEITVSDTGIGIPQAEQERIFERFYRVDAARSRQAGGTGLGLSIARHIVEAHGGRIWVESAVGEGSRFRFRIPAAA